MAHTVTWFELPAANLDRAMDFYNEVLDTEMYRKNLGGEEFAFFPAGQQDISGALVQIENYEAPKNAPMVYLNGGKDLNEPLSRIEKAGGKVLMEKTKISDEYGYFATFKDSEGNRVALHSLE